MITTTPVITNPDSKVYYFDFDANGNVEIIEMTVKESAIERIKGMKFFK